MTTTTAATTPAFHTDDSEQASEYSSLSVLAISSLVLGVLAPLALTGSFWLAIPILGIAVAFLALRAIAASDGGLAGRWAAIAGLALCVASLLAPFSRDYVQRVVRSNQAEEAAQHWLKLVTSGELSEAFRLTSEGVRPTPPPSSDLGMPGAAPAAPQKTPLQTFEEKPIVQELKAIGPKAQIRYEETFDFAAASYRDVWVAQRFTVSPASGTTAQPVEVNLTMQRVRASGENMSRWLIKAFDKAATTK